MFRYSRNQHFFTNFCLKNYKFCHEKIKKCGKKIKKNQFTYSFGESLTALIYHKSFLLKYLHENGAFCQSVGVRTICDVG